MSLKSPRGQWVNRKDVYTLFISLWRRVFAAVIHRLDFAEKKKVGLSRKTLTNIIKAHKVEPDDPQQWSKKKHFHLLSQKITSLIIWGYNFTCPGTHLTGPGQLLLGMWTSINFSNIAICGALELSQFSPHNLYAIAPCEGEIWGCFFLVQSDTFAGIILSMSSANERRRHNVKSSLNGRAHIQNDPCFDVSLS